MATLTFYPLGNADCCQIVTKTGTRILFDYAHIREAENQYDPRCDLKTLLLQDLQQAKRKDFDVVAFTHLDRDHCGGAGDMFYFEHAAKYQDKDRIKIKTLWVPAAAILEENDPCEDARLIRQEARHRLKEGKGILVFSRPDMLKDWFKAEKLSLESRQHMIIDAGNIVPGVSLAGNGIEFFIHSPFAMHLDDGSLVERNQTSLVMQAVIEEGGQQTKIMLGADVDYAHLQDIVNVTRHHKRDSKLEWDIFKLPHHCSYKTLAEEKGSSKTIPVDEVEWLFETQGQPGGIIISTSDSIPSEDTKQPPHMQAANYYKDVAKELGGEFIVTMEHPKVSKPEPLVIEVGEAKARIRRQVKASSVTILQQHSPRAG